MLWVCLWEGFGAHFITRWSFRQSFACGSFDTSSCKCFVIMLHYQLRLFSACCGFIIITGRTWRYFGTCSNFPSYCRAEGLPTLLAPHTRKSNRSRVIPQQVDALTSPLNCCRDVSAAPFTFAPYLSPRRGTGGSGEGWWKQELGEAFHISPLPLSNTKNISLRRFCLGDGDAKWFSGMAIGLIQFGSLKITDSAIVKYALSLITANLFTCI